MSRAFGYFYCSYLMSVMYFSIEACFSWSASSCSLASMCLRDSSRHALATSRHVCFNSGRSPGKNSSSDDSELTASGRASVNFLMLSLSSVFAYTSLMTGSYLNSSGRTVFQLSSSSVLVCYRCLHQFLSAIACSLSVLASPCIAKLNLHWKLIIIKT